MIITTTPTIEGHPVRQYKGIVSSETVIGANAIKDFFASITDIVGGRSSSYESVLEKGKEIAVKEIEERARKIGANAIVGLSLNYETLGNSGGMIMVTATGTAVIV